MIKLLLCCDECGWEGYRDELVRLSDDPDDSDFSYCPNCEGSDFTEIEEEYNEEE